MVALGAVDVEKVWKVLAVVQLVICLIISFSQQYWCQFLHFFDVDFCWFLSADPTELKRGFPRFHQLLYLLNLALDYGVPALSLGVLMLVYRKDLQGNMMLLMFSTVFALGLGELVLRMAGWKPGQFGYSQWIQPVDSVYVVQGFVTDEFGVCKVDVGLTNKIAASPEVYSEKNLPYPENWGYWAELANVFTNHGLMEGSELPENEFWKRLQELKKRGKGVTALGDNLLLHYAKNPFNSEGFYSIPFDTTRIGHGRILLLGDSFTWGHSAENITSSFANTLLARGYTIYNSGISATDVPQYHAVLSEYGIKLKPNVVVVNFFIGNDVSYFSRKPSKEVPICFHTNAGVILSDQLGVQFSSSQQAYDNVMRNMVIPQTTGLNSWMSKTVVTTIVWEFLAHQGIIDHEFFIGANFPDRPITAREIRSLKETCDTLGSRLILSVIPKLEKGKLVGAESIPNLFGDVPYHQPNMTVEMYNRKDGHFNDEGHLVYANYLEKLIKAELEKAPLER